jgi:hypothetical protein
MVYAGRNMDCDRRDGDDVLTGALMTKSVSEKIESVDNRNESVP